MASPPLTSAGGNALNGVAALSAANVYAVGYQSTANLSQLTPIEHWDGQRWKVLTSPDPSADTNSLTAITAISPDDIWAVGYAGNEVEEGIGTLAMHFNGTKWSIISTPSEGAAQNLNAIIRVPGTRILGTVGAYSVSGWAYDDDLLLDPSTLVMIAPKA